MLKPISEHKRHRVESAAIKLLLTFGVVLRLSRYVDDRSVWWDEAALALNVLTRSFNELASPLRYAQSAGIGFLWTTKAVTLTSGGETLSLRFVPMVASVLSVPMFYLLARRLLKGVGLILAVGMLALNQWLIYYAAEFKPYSVDVLLTVVLMWLALRATDDPNNRRRQVVLIAIAMMSLWYSQTIVFVCAGVTAALIVDAACKKQTQTVRVYAVGGVLMAGCFAMHYQMMRLPESASQYLLRYWDSAFPPFWPKSLTDLSWYGQQSILAMKDPCGIALTWLSLPLLVIGAVMVWRQQKTAGLVMMLPAAAVFIASLLKLYPLILKLPYQIDQPSVGRQILFLTPMAYLLIGFAVQAIDKKQTVLAWAVAASLLVLPTYDAMTNLINPPRFQELRELRYEIMHNTQPDDTIYLSHYSLLTWQYLELVDESSAKLNVVVCHHQPDLTAHAAQLKEKLSGSGRVWVVFAHHKTTATGPQELMVLSWLDQTARRRMEIETPGTRAVLYQLTRPF